MHMFRVISCITWLYCTSALAISRDKSIISLQQLHPLSTPMAALSSLADDCKTLGIKSFDVYGDFESNVTSSYLRQFEQEVAQEFGKEDAVFMPSGVMAQSIALMIHSKGKRSFACHETSHLLLHEQEGYHDLLHMDPIVISTQTSGSFRTRPLEYGDVKKALSTEKIGKVGTLMLELPHRELGGKCTPWVDILEMQQYCKENDIQFHCDGARIFEATAGYDKSVRELTGPFDSIYISFYKGLGGLSGAMLLGRFGFCNEARVWLRRFGGNLYTLLPYAVSGWSGYRKHYVDASITFHDKQQKLARIVELLSTHDRIRECVSFDPDVPQVNMIHGYLCHSKQECMDAIEMVEKQAGIQVLSRLRDVQEAEPAYKEGYRCKFELLISDSNRSIEDAVFLQGWKAFVLKLKTNKLS